MDQQFSPPKPIDLLDLLIVHVNDAELRHLCFRFQDKKYDDLSGESLIEKFIDLIEFAKRHGNDKYLKLWKSFVHVYPDAIKESTLTTLGSGIYLAENLNLQSKQLRKLDRKLRITQDMIQEDQILIDLDLSYGNVIMAGLDLSDYYLPGAVLDNVILVRAQLPRANLRKCSFKGADLTEASFSKAILFDAKLNNAHLFHSDLSHARMDRADFRGANLSETDFHDSSLVNAKLIDCTLVDSIFTDADLTGCDLSNSNLHRAKFQNAKLIEVNLSGTDLTGADLTNADLRGANLTEANLQNAILIDARITGEQLQHAKTLQGASMNESSTIEKKTSDVFLMNFSKWDDDIQSDVQEILHKVYVDHDVYLLDMSEIDFFSSDMSIEGILHEHLNELVEQGAWKTALFIVRLERSTQPEILKWIVIAELSGRLGYLPYVFQDNDMSLLNLQAISNLG